jgi:5-methyltetrahydrofolate--homocysteine methyltransferase
MCGGAAINPSFVRASAYVDEEQTELYAPGVWYCKDAFEGLAVVEALVGGAAADFTRRRLDQITERVERRAALKEKAKDMRPADRPGPSKDVDVPAPSFLGVKVIDRIPLRELYPLIDLNTLYRLHWGAKNAKGEEYERLKREEFEPRLERYRKEALAGGRARVRAAYGFWPADAEGDDVVVRDPQDPEREVARFPFPRQSDRERLCLSDYFKPASDREDDGGVATAAEPVDYVGFLIVSVSDSLLEESETKMKEGEYTEGYYLHGFGVRLAEAAAEWVHRRMREEWGIDDDRGLRYAWGYPACPDHTQHEILYDLLPAREKLGMELTGAGALVPELSTAAIVVHHPEAKYFSAG